MVVAHNGVALVSFHPENCHSKATDLQRFIERARQVTRLTELTPEIVHEFIEKIVVSKPEKVDGKRYQRVDIYYSTIGLWTAPGARVFGRLQSHAETQEKDSVTVATLPKLDNLPFMPLPRSNFLTRTAPPERLLFCTYYTSIIHQKAACPAPGAPRPPQRAARRARRASCPARTASPPTAPW